MHSQLKRARRTVLAICFLLLSNLTQAASLEIDVATAYAADNFHTQNLQQYANDVAKATTGQVNFRVHPAGSLIKPAEIFNGVRSGKAGAGEVIMSGLAKEHPLFGMDALPFIVSGYEDARRMWDVSRPSIEKALTERGLQLLYSVPWPPQGLYSRTAIATLQDFKGLRMRSYSPAIERISTLIGARPVTIQLTDLSRAIAEEKVDLVLTSSQTGVETKAWSKLQYFYKVNAWIPKNVVFINKKVFDGLDADTRVKLLDAARLAEERGWKLSQGIDREYEIKLVENKMHVAMIDPYIRRYLERIGENHAREWLKHAGHDELTVLLKYTTDRPMK
jgi:TRAP-type C4-dicarboxylate transport system substrate-binding protein